MSGALSGAAYLNGEFVSADEAKVSIFDSGFIGGVSFVVHEVFGVDPHRLAVARVAMLLPLVDN